jgi:hypothetical protein
VLLEPVFDSHAYGILDNCIKSFLRWAHPHLVLSFLMRTCRFFNLTLVNTAFFGISFGLESAFKDFLAVDFGNQSFLYVLFLLNLFVIFFLEYFFTVLVALLKFLLSLFHVKQHTFFVFFALSFESLNSLVMHFCFRILGFSLL